MTSKVDARNCVIYVGGLDQAVTEDILYTAFIPFGHIQEINIPRDLNSYENHRGFAFVEFELLEDAKEAVSNMHRSELFGKIIKCQLAKPNAILPYITVAPTKAIWNEEEWLRTNMSEPQ